jgi:hypothetical protein
MGEAFEVTLSICLFIAGIWLTVLFMLRVTANVKGGKPMLDAMKQAFKDFWRSS